MWHKRKKKWSYGLSKFMESVQDHHNPEWVLLSNLQQKHQMLQLQYNTVPQSIVQSNNSHN